MSLVKPGWGTEIGILIRILKATSDRDIVFLNFSREKLIQLAELHRVNYRLLSYARMHPDLLTGPQTEDLSARCRQNALLSLGQLQELIRIAQNLERARIPFVVIKGPQLAHMIYGREAMKESLDLDIMLVRGSMLNEAHLMFSSIGYKQSNLNAYPGNISRKIFLVAKREVHYVNPVSRVHIDLHIRPGSNTYLTAGLFRNFFDTTETYDLEGCPVLILPAELYFTYLCYHGSLHQFSRLAWLMDIRAFLEVKGNSLDYRKVLSQALGMKAERSLFIAMILLRDLFDDPIPGVIENAIIQNGRMRFLVKSCRNVFMRDGNYGLTLQGRWHKLVYMMVLIRGMAGRIDLLYGIFMRALAGRIRAGRTRDVSGTPED